METVPYFELSDRPSSQKTKMKYKRKSSFSDIIDLLNKVEQYYDY